MSVTFASVRRKGRSCLTSIAVHVLASLLVISVGGEKWLLAGSLFIDVPSTHPHERAITWMEEQGLVRGYADGQFAPEASVNRAEFVRFVISATGLKSRAETCLREFRDRYGSKAQFLRDISPGAWYEGDVCAALEQGIVTGYSDKSFRPDRPVSFAEAAVILQRAYDLPAGVTDDQSPWYRSAVEALAVSGAIPADVENFDNPLTRGIVAEMIYRVALPVTNLPSLTYEQVRLLSAMKPAAPSLDDLPAELFSLINAKRWDAGVPPARINPTLERAARLHAEDMASRGYFSHEGRGGVLPPARMKAAGYETVTLENCGGCKGIEYKYGEILDRNALPEEALASFMSTAAHRSVLLSSDFDEVGIAFSGGIYVVDFAKTVVSY